MHQNNYLLVKKDIEKYHKVGFIEPIDYSPWLANIILSLKPNGQIICYIYFKELNKACPKENFPLPQIDIIMDSTIGDEVISFLDDFFGYNQNHNQ